MTNISLPRDNNRITVIGGTSSTDGVTPVTIYADPTTHRLLVDTSSTGTVSSVSVVSANGFAGTVANATTTPAITLSTTITGILKGDGTSISAASAGTDYLAPNGSGTGLTITSQNVGNSTNLDTFLTNIDDSISSSKETGFGAWTSGTDANTYTLTGGKLQVNRSGYGYINGKKVSWTANQQTGVFAANNFYFVYFDANGNIQTSTTFVANVIRVFEVLYDGTNYFVAKENHPKEFQTAVSGYLHSAINTIIFGTGANITRVATGTGAASGDRQVKIVGADTLADHGLSTAIPDSAGTGVTWNTMYRNAGGKWVLYASQQELPMFFNNAGTPTALDATPNIFSVYVLYVKKDDINSSSPQYFATMNEASYATLGAAQAAITNGTVIFETNELKSMEAAQLGYAIVQYSATGGYIEEVQVAKSTLNQQFVGGGGGAGADHALLSHLDFASAGHTGFTSPSSTDTFTNKTYDTAGTGNVLKINGVQVSDKTGTGKVVLDTSPTLTTPLLGTPTSGTLTNCTGLPIAGLVSSTSTALGVGSIELGHATDTTIARVSAGVISVEGVTVDTISATNTLTNKRITKRTGTTTSSATPTINTDLVDFYSLTAQAVDITSFTTNLSGTPAENQTLWIAITGTAARAITWGTSFEASTVALPTTTVTTNRLDVGFVWNTVTSKWRCVAVA